MKIFITLLLIFTIFNDFSSASFHEEEVSNCESQSNCVSSDIHTESSSHHNSESDDHNCHMGHSHTVIIDAPMTLITSISPKFIHEFPVLQIGNLHNYFNDIVRPPIA